MIIWFKEQGLLQALVQSGNSLGVKMDQLAMANQALSAALNWVQRAERIGFVQAEMPVEARPSLAEVGL